MIEKIYCINLDRRSDRWLQASQEFAREGLQVERFPAVDGREIKHSSCYENKQVAGCTLSHFLVVARAAILGFESVLVFEDDVQLAPNFYRQLLGCLRVVPPDWQMLYLGGTHVEKPDPVNKKILRVSNTLTTHGYIIRSTMYEKVISRLGVADEPADVLFAEFQKSSPVYVTNPPLAWQAAGYSDLAEGWVDYDWLRTNEQT